MLSRSSVGIYQGNELTSNSSGNNEPQSSQLAEPSWTDSDLKKKGIVMRELVSIYKKEKKRAGGN